MRVVCDGAPCHSDGVLNLPDNMMLVKLPPRSPALNPAENNWDDMREKLFHNKLFNSMKAVEKQLVVACQYYQNHPEVLHSMTSWDWILNYSID